MLIDSAGGKILGALAPTVLVNGAPVAVIGAQVEGHGDDIHANPVMATGSPTVLANGIPVCRLLDTANCGHATSGSPNVMVGP